MSKETQEIQNIVAQAKAPDLSAVTEAGGQGALVPVQSPNELVAVVPKHLDKSREETIGKEASEIVDAIKTDPGDWKHGDLIYNLGKDVITQVNTESSLYHVKMADVVKSATADESAVGSDILAIKNHLDMVNPVVVGNTEIEFKEKALKIFTKVVKRVPKGDEILKIISERRETVDTAIDGIANHLRGEKDLIIMQASELGTICDNLKNLQPALQEEIFKGQLIWKFLMEYLGQLEGMEKETVNNMTSDLAMGVVDLQTIDNMTLQTRYGGEMTIRNSRLTTRLVDRTMTILMGSVKNALAVRAAANQLLKTQSHLQAVNDAIGQTMVDTAKAVGQATVQGAQMSQEAVANINYLQEACNEYELAAEAYTEVCKQTLSIATQSNNSLNTMNAKLRARTDAMTSSRQDS